MQLNVATLLTVHGLVTLALEGLLIVFWLAHRRIPGLALWTLANAMLGIATITMAFRPYLHPVIGAVLANSVLFAGLGILWYGVRVFNGRSVAWRCGIAACIAFMLALAYVVLVADDFKARVVITCAAYAALSFAAAHELMRRSEHRSHSIASAAAVLFFVQGASFLVRVGRIVLAPEDGDLFTPSTVTSGFLLATIIDNILLVACLVMLAAQRLQARLETALVRVEAASRGKSEFLATMSHELRTPLNAIIGFSDVMRQQLFGPHSAKQYLGYSEDIHASGTHLLDLITTLLDVSKAEAGRLEVSPEWVDVGRIGRDAVKLVSEAAVKRSVALSLTISEPVPPCWADERALRQILLNLLSNAVKFTPAGGNVNVTVEDGRDDGIRLRIADTGIGIAPAEIPRLIRPFEQMSNAYSRSEGGTGLGLPLVDALVRLHRGELKITSAPGAGTEVLVWLPPETYQGGGARRLAQTTAGFGFEAAA
jgi:signal transduction histidine kinase